MFDMEATQEMDRRQVDSISPLKRLIPLCYYARSRGWPYILSWAHRATGVILVLYLLIHVYTLSALPKTEVFAAKMAFYNNLVFSFLEWAIAILLVFHALNGARLILYEIFHARDDNSMIRWVAVLGIIYILTLGYFMIIGGQETSVKFYWLITLILSCIVGYVVYQKIWMAHNRSLWKLQRISGAFLLPMTLAHMLFMHVNYLTGHDAGIITIRMQGYLTKGIDFILVALVIYHGAYGLCSIISDYVGNIYFRRLLAISIILILADCLWIGVKLIIAI